MLTVAELMNDAIKLESNYNREIYKGKVSRIRINSRLIDELVKDHKDGHKVVFENGLVEINGIELIPTSDIETLELIYSERI